MATDQFSCCLVCSLQTVPPFAPSPPPTYAIRTPPVPPHRPCTLSLHTVPPHLSLLSCACCPRALVHSGRHKAPRGSMRGKESPLPRGDVGSSPSTQINLESNKVWSRKASSPHEGAARTFRTFRSKRLWVPQMFGTRRSKRYLPP